MVDTGNFRLVGLEIAGGLKVVEDSRHKAVPVASPSYLSAISCEVTHFAILADDEYTEHLAPADFLPPFLPLRKQRLELLASEDTEGMRFVTEGIVHPFGKGTMVGNMLKRM